MSDPLDQTTTGTAYTDGTLAKIYPTEALVLDNHRTLRLSPDTDAAHYVELAAADAMASNYQLKFPAANGQDLQSLRVVAGQLEWFTPASDATLTAYKTALPFKSAAQAVAPGNIDMTAGNPGTIDGVDFTFGGVALLPYQTNPSEIGLWRVDLGGIWTRDATMPDLFTAVCAIVPVFPGGTLYGSTIWFSTLDGSGNVVFLQIPTAATPFKVTRLTTTQRNALTGVNGDLIYNTTTNKFQGYEAGAWVNLV